MSALSRAILLMITALACCGAALAAEGAPSGIFLVASRTIRDPNFSKSVILVTQLPGGGPVGVIINRPLGRRLSELFPEFETLKSNDEVVYFGGPVARDGLVFVVRSDKPLARGMRVLKDVYLTGDPDTVGKLLSRSDPTKGLRVYSGYSGWGSRQLQNEIDRGDWYLLPADVETVFEKRADRIWPELISRATLRRTGLGCFLRENKFICPSLSHVSAKVCCDYPEMFSQPARHAVDACKITILSASGIPCV